METLTMPGSLATVSDGAVQAHVAAAVAQLQEQHLQQQQHQQLQHSSVLAQQQLVNLNDITDLAHEMPDDIVSIPKEVILISLVSQEQALYNPKHEHYRSPQRKDCKWVEIAENVGWTEPQCKAKWKAMRDQYCRELKRSKLNAKANVKWKYFKELDFLRPYALSRKNIILTTTATTGTNTASTQATETAFTSNSYSNSSSNNNSTISDNNNKFGNIKIEPSLLTDCDFTSTAATMAAVQTLKSEPTRLMQPMTDEQINNLLQQQNDSWNYLTAPTTTTTTATSTPSNCGDNNHEQQTTVMEDEAALYNALAECGTASTNAGDQLTQQQQQQQQHTEEEDEDPIHTFLNIESYFERKLISIIQQQDILYNNYHPNYRTVKMKGDVWEDIARELKKTVKQCRQKWKALRDQYIREYKRLKNRENADTLPRWKHYDALNFLEKFIKQKTSESSHDNLLQLPKNGTDTDIEEPLATSSPMHSPLEQQQQLSMPTLTAPHLQEHQQNTDDFKNSQEDNGAAALCVAASYSEMDIDYNMIGDASDDPHDDVDDMDEDEEEDEDHKSVQQFTDYTDTNTPHMQNATDDNDHEFLDMKVSISKELVDLKTDDDMDNDGGTSTTNANQINEPMQTLAMHQTQQNRLEFHTEQAQTTTVSILNGIVAVAANDTNACNNFINNNHNKSNNTTAAPIIGNISSGVGNSPKTAVVAAQIVAATTIAASPTVSTAPISTLCVANNNTNNNNNNNPNNSNNMPNSDDDEVGAFFKAVAMKIRNAKMTPVAFTDLQIDILRVINGSLRNH